MQYAVGLEAVPFPLFKLKTLPARIELLYSVRFDTVVLHASEEKYAVYLHTLKQIIVVKALMWLRHFEL